MISEWLSLNSGPGSPVFNMALDEALLEAMPRLGQPVLRLYAWTEPAASFGYFQKYADVERLTPLRPLVRRPTAGGVVPHDADWTYSLVFPPSHEWYGTLATESYHRLHLWLQTSFTKLGLETQLAPAKIKITAGQCFVGHEQADLLWHGRKIAGAAQRRRKDGLLIQGSVQPPDSSVTRKEWEEALRETATGAYHIAWREYPDDPGLSVRATELMELKYNQRSYTQRR
jgi:lipoate-protein ligase A